MAHRNIKITRDIVQTCNKLRALNKLDQCTLQPHKSIETSKNISNDVKSTGIHSSASRKQKVTNSKTSKHVNNSILETCAIINKKRLGNELRACTTISLPLTTTARHYSSSTNKSRENKCLPSKKCVRNPDCPRFSIDDCTPAKGSNCKKVYQDPHCTKQMAPYPSYSELCAFRMEEDPSECRQCPWQKCRGVDDIKPQGKKSFHTSTKEMNMAMIPAASTNFVPLIFPNQCDARKEPCKEPPPKCKKEDKKEKCPEKKKKEKTCELMMNQAWVVSGSLQNLQLQKLSQRVMNLAFFDKSFGVLNHGQKFTYRLKDCPEKPRKCPKFEIVPPKWDDTINERAELLFSAKEHDKGQPPPCEPTSKPSSRQCPADTPKKKYKQERDLYESQYRRNPKPYSDDDLKK